MPSVDGATSSCAAAAKDTGLPAQLRVPTTRQAESWWNPAYWSMARPTDFSYGDCVWGLESQPVPLSVIEWERKVFLLPLQFSTRTEQIANTQTGF